MTTIAAHRRLALAVSQHRHRAGEIVRRGHEIGNLSRALARSPGLTISFERRRSFVRTALESIARIGESATMREIAADYTSSRGVTGYTR